MIVETKAAVTVAEMGRMCGLSRARFYQLIGATFPMPVYDVATRRPFYDEEAQKVCLEVRRRNCGIDGRTDFVLCEATAGGTFRNECRGLLQKAGTIVLIARWTAGVGI